MTTQSVERYWRVRMNFGTGGEALSREAWTRDEVGVWYGGWTSDDFFVAQSKSDGLAFLNSTPGQKACQGLKEVTKVYWDTVVRFSKITDRDWVVIAFDGSIHLARPVSPMRSIDAHPLDRYGERFHFRKIGAKKSFPLAELPESFRLVPMAGRGNINEFWQTRDLVRLLAESATALEVRKKVDALSIWEWIDVLGPRGWESLCLGYLVIKESFVPTGLLVGGTLPDLDIVGRSQSDGARVVAQCKKDPRQVEIGPEFFEACAALGDAGRSYYFAFGGCRGEVPPKARVIGRREIEEAAKEDDSLRRYLELFKG